MIDSLYLICRIGADRVAVRAREIVSVVKIGQMTPIPGAPVHVAGLFALRSRVLTVIDAGISVGGAPVGSAPGRKMVVINIDDHAYGILVDGVDDVVAIDGGEAAPHSGISGNWMELTAATVIHDTETLIVLDLRRILAGTEPMAA